jgi:hypothetical protein
MTGHVADGAVRPVERVRLCWNSKQFWLASAEGNDASHGIVGRDAYRDAISRDYLDPEAAHAAAQLGQDFVAGVALHAVKTAAVNRHDRALHVDEIVLAQMASNPFLFLAFSSQLSAFGGLSADS